MVETDVIYHTWTILVKHSESPSENDIMNNNELLKLSLKSWPKFVLWWVTGRHVGGQHKLLRNIVNLKSNPPLYIIILSYPEINNSSPLLVEQFEDLICKKLGPVSWHCVHVQYVFSVHHTFRAGLLWTRWNHRHLNNIHTMQGWIFCSKIARKCLKKNNSSSMTIHY